MNPRMIGARHETVQVSLLFILSWSQESDVAPPPIRFRAQVSAMLNIMTYDGLTKLWVAQFTLNLYCILCIVASVLNLRVYASNFQKFGTIDLRLLVQELEWNSVLVSGVTVTRELTCPQHYAYKTMSSSTMMMEVISDVCSGIVVGSSHGLWFAQDWVRRRVIRPTKELLGAAPDNSDKNSDANKTLKVIGVGYGRTGTYSLALALEELGYPTLHTQHMYESRDILDMWTTQVFSPCIESGQASLKPPSLDVIVQHGYTATMDLPVALYFEQIMQEYPESKFILTTRETSQIWFNSWNTLTKAITVPTHRFGWMWHAKKLNMYYRWLFSLINQDDSFLTAPLPLPPQDETKAIESYEAHNACVRAVIPSDRLLEYNIREGWEPLCEFLNVDDCPTDTPFPKSNSALSVKVQTVSAMVMPITLTILVLSLVFSKLWRRAKTIKIHVNTNGSANGSTKTKTH